LVLYYQALRAIHLELKIIKHAYINVVQLKKSPILIDYILAQVNLVRLRDLVDLASPGYRNHLEFPLNLFKKKQKKWRDKKICFNQNSINTLFPEDLMKME